MLIEYLANLILLSISYNLLMMVVMIPISLGVALLSRGSDARSPVSAFVSQLSVALVLSIGLAVFTSVFVEYAQPVATWPYIVLGLLVTFMLLSQNAADKQQHGVRSIEIEDRAVAAAAAWGVIVALPTFGVFYIWPELALSIGPVSTVLQWTFNLAAWLVGFWLVRILLMFIVLRLLFIAGTWILFGGAIAAFAALSGAQKVLGTTSRDA